MQHDNTYLREQKIQTGIVLIQHVNVKLYRFVFVLTIVNLYGGLCSVCVHGIYVYKQINTILIYTSKIQVPPTIYIHRARSPTGTRTSRIKNNICVNSITDLISAVSVTRAEIILARSVTIILPFILFLRHYSFVHWVCSAGSKLGPVWREVVRQSADLVIRSSRPWLLLCSLLIDSGRGSRDPREARHKPDRRKVVYIMTNGVVMWEMRRGPPSVSCGVKIIITTDQFHKLHDDISAIQGNSRGHTTFTPGSSVPNITFERRGTFISD